MLPKPRLAGLRELSMIEEKSGLAVGSGLLVAEATTWLIQVHTLNSLRTLAKHTSPSFLS